MRQCPECGMEVQLGKIYCPACGSKMAFIEKDIAEKAVEERRREKLTKAHNQLIQWVGLAILILVVANMFRDLSNRMPHVDVKPFFYGPPVVGAGSEGHIMVIGRGDSYLELGQRTMDISEVETLDPDEATPEQKEADAGIVTGMLDSQQQETFTTSEGKVIKGRLLGRTETFVVIDAGGSIQIVPADKLK